MPKNSRSNRKLHPLTKKQKAAAAAALAADKAVINELKRTYGSVKTKGGKSRRTTRKTKNRRGGQIVGFNSRADPIYYK